MSPRRPRAPAVPPRAGALLSLPAILFLSAACGGEAGPEPPDREWPAGTVLAVEDLPITAAEVDAASAWVEPIDRKASPEHLRRLALTNVVLPDKVARLLAPEARERALEEALASLAELRAGTWSGPTSPDGAYGTIYQGHFKIIGIPVWGTALTLEEGEWSDPVEDAGRFVLVRKLRTIDAAVPLATEFEVDLIPFDYLDMTTAPADIELAYDRFRMTLVDPAWRALVPELIQYRMGVHQP